MGGVWPPVKVERGMGLRTALPFLLLGVLAGCSGADEFDSPRDLSQLRFDQLPKNLPAAWQAQLSDAFVGAPEMSLMDPGAMDEVRDRLSRVAWIDPSSVRVASALPDGLRVKYRPRVPRLIVTSNAVPVGILARDGTLLPEGIPDSLAVKYMKVPLEPGEVLPPIGGRVANALLQEALDVADEAYTLRTASGLQIASIERQSGYPLNAGGVPPALCFRLADGREIGWGRAESSDDPSGQSLARKVVRLREVLEAFPDLVGVHRIQLDYPELHLYGPDGVELPLPESLRGL